MNKLFDNRIESENIIFRYASGKSIESGREFHIYHEIIYLIDGDAEFISENMHTDINPNTLIIIPKETYHKVIIHGNQEQYHRCTISLYENSEMRCLIEKCTKNTAILPVDIDMEFLLERLSANTNNENAALLLKATVILLLDKISEKRSADSTENRQNPVIKNALSYINDNINKKITTSEIAKNCMVSESALSHIFKKEFNITIHKFVIKKKLINARNKIKAGIPSTLAATECGFNDYSGFYKQYKKMFGSLPSDTSEKSRLHQTDKPD